MKLTTTNIRNVTKIYIFLILILKIFLVLYLCLFGHRLFLYLYLVFFFSSFMQSILFPRAYFIDYKIKSHSSYKGFDRYTIDFNSIYKEVFTLGLGNFQ